MKDKITVTIERRPDNSLRLRWNDGKRRSLALGLMDSVPSRALAGNAKQLIEQDFKDGLYDPSDLFKYYPQTIGSNATDITAPELFDRFTRHKIKCGDITQHTASIGYHTAKRLLERELNIEVSAIGRKSAEALTDHIKENMQPSSGKQMIFMFKSCWDWAKGQYRVEDKNPWENLTGRFKAIQPKPIEPLTRDEVAKVLATFRAVYPEYLDYVVFCFGTGCRPGEAVALKWSSVKPDSVWIGESITGQFHNPTTKTGKNRTVLLSPKVAAMLEQRREIWQPSPGELVFPNEDGTAINCHAHYVRWQTVLKKAGVPKRKPYITRHTAISHALEAGANPVDVAAQTGHDLATLLSFYAHVIEQKRVFVEF
jgi:integrase